MGADIAKHELITVGRRPGHARAAGHAAGASDVLDDDLLAQKLGKLWGQNPPDTVGRTAGRERNHHGHRAARPLLRQRRRTACENGERGGRELACHKSSVPA